MPGLGFAEVLFIFVAALLLFGPRRLPQLGRTLGKGLAEFRKATNELKRTIDAEGLEADLRETRETIEAVDPRRYLKEAMSTEVDRDRVPRRRRPPDATIEDPANTPDTTSASPDDPVPVGGEANPPATDSPGSDAPAAPASKTDPSPTEPGSDASPGPSATES